MDNPGGVLILSGVLGDTRRYRALHLLQQLRLAGVDCSLGHISDPNAARLAADARVLVLQRVGDTPLARSLLDQVHRSGGVALYDTDDLIFDPQAFQWIHSPDFKMAMRRSLYQQDMLLQRALLQACDGCLVSTDYLAGLVRPVSGKPVWVHRNAANVEMAGISETFFNRRRPPDGRVIIGYASGTPTHSRDFALVAPALRQLLRAHSQAELWVIGHLHLDDSWREFGARVRTFNAVKWRDLPARLADLDINLAPLAQDNPFSQSKSEIKWMEAALVGVPTIASATDAFQYAIRDGQNGLLVHTDADWLPALERLLDADYRERLGAAARDAALAGYLPLQRARDALNLLNNTAAGLNLAERWQFRPLLKGSLGAYAFTAAEEKEPSLWQMGLYNLRQRGAGVLARRVLIQARRFLARWFPFKGGGA